MGQALAFLRTLAHRRTAGGSCPDPARTGFQTAAAWPCVPPIRHRTKCTSRSGCRNGRGSRSTRAARRCRRPLVLSGRGKCLSLRHWRHHNTSRPGRRHIRPGSSHTGHPPRRSDRCRCRPPCSSSPPCTLGCRGCTWPHSASPASRSGCRSARCSWFPIRIRSDSYTGPMSGAVGRRQRPWWNRPRSQWAIGIPSHPAPRRTDPRRLSRRIFPGWNRTCLHCT